MIPSFARLKLEDLLQEKIVHQDPASGGSIAVTYFIQTHKNHSYFLKWDQKNSGMLDAEVKGLELLRKSESFRIPEVFAHNSTFLVMEAILPQRAPKSNFWDRFAEKLAKLHQFQETYWGLKHDNFIGATQQTNSISHTSWKDFFIEQRIKPQLKLLKLNGLNKTLIFDLQLEMFKRISDLLSEVDEAPSLLHGDLWSGNYLVGQNNEPIVIDPAPYFGHREAEFSIMKLFGGFPEAFYTRYHEIYPFAAGAEQRIQIYTLYHLLNHANLFGASYLQQSERLVKKIIGP
ncbi:MAG: fructosamine kinase family protein [Oligoflexus sp.]